jgi:betaine-homocysteine S-methyltransferase
MRWAADADVDFIIGETFYYAQEAFCALEAIQAVGTIPSVITIAPMGENKMRDDFFIPFEIVLH